MIALFNGNQSAPSIAAIGYATSTVTALTAPVLTASKDLYDTIKLSWTEVPLANKYIIYRGTSSLFWYAEELIRVETLAYNDDTAVPGTLYYYWIESNTSYLSMIDFSSINKSSAPSAVAQGRVMGTTTMVVNGDTKIICSGKDSCVYYSIENVPVGTTRLVAMLTGTNNALLNDCDIYAKFGSRPSTISYNAKGVESISGESLTISNPAAGTWYLMLYGVTDYGNVTMTVNYYSATDIVLIQVPLNDQTVPFTANFKGRVVDDDKTVTGIGGLAIQVRNPITGITSWLPAKTDASGYFTYSTVINTEGEHTFDFFFTTMTDDAKGTASHTVATRKGCMETNGFFDFSAYLPATPVAVPLQPDIVGLQTFLDIRNGWDFLGTVTPGSTYETLWINSTIVKAEKDTQLIGKLDEGLYMFFYGVEGAGVGNDTTTTSQLSAVPFVVHVNSSTASTLSTVVTNLNTLGIIDNTNKAEILAGKIGIVAIASLSNPDEAASGNYNISLLAREQLEILAKLATGSGGSVEAKTYSGVAAKKVTVTLENGRQINVVGAGFVK